MGVDVAVHKSISQTPIPSNAQGLPTVCVLCSHNCGITVDVVDGEITKIQPDKNNPITYGYICNKAMSVGKYARHAQRVEHPMRRRPDGTFEQVSWDTALTEIGEKLTTIREEHSPKSIGLIGIGGQANHMDGAYGLNFLSAVGSKRWYNAFAQEKHQHFLISHWMFDAPPTAFYHPDIANTDYLLVMGTNPKISNRGHNANDTFRDLSKDDSVRIVIIDPRETETTRLADKHLKAKPGTNAYLLLGIAATLVREEGLVDPDYIKNNTLGFDALCETLNDIDVGEMATRCGLTREEIEETAREFASAERAAIMWDLAVEQIPYSTLVSYLMHLIPSLTGNVGKKGGMHFMGSATPPEWSPKRFDEPERAHVSGIRAIPALGGFAMFSPTLVPEEVLSDHEDRLRAVIIEGSNPYLSYSDTSRWREAREKLDLMVVIEPAMTETAWDADYVLPVPTGYEKWEQAGFPKGFPGVYMQLRPPVLPAIGDVLPEPEIYVQLCEKMGLVPPVPEKVRDLAKNARTPQGAAAFLMEVQQAAPNATAMMVWTYRTVGELLPSPALAAIWLQSFGNAFARPAQVKQAFGDKMPSEDPFEMGHVLFEEILAHPEGLEIARLNDETNLQDNLGWDDKKIRLLPDELKSEIKRCNSTPPETDENYPFVLAAGLRTSWTANTIQRDPTWRKGRGPHCTLHLSPQDAETLNIETGDAIRVSTRRGEVELPAEVDKRCQEGHVWIPNGFGMITPNSDPKRPVLDGVNTNELTDVADRDPISGCPHHKYTLCHLERVA